MRAATERSPLSDRGLKPAAQLAAGRPHGDRLRYVAGCRCDECRRANTQYERQRVAARAAGDWNGIVPAERARKHMRWLSRQGVGRRAIADASDVAETILMEIRSGRRVQIRARTERRILAVTPAMASDRALVAAGPSWDFIAALKAAGFTKKRLARELGQKGTGLQLGRVRVTVRNAARVERLHARLMASGEVLVDAARSWRLIRILRDELYPESRIAREIGFDDGVLRLGRSRVTRAQAERIAAAYRRLTT